MFSIGVFAIILNNKQQILLSHRNDMDLWNLPGGGLKSKESPPDGLSREVKEETGLTVIVNKLVALNSKPHDNEIVFTFMCKIEKGKITLTDEASQHKWFDYDNLPLNIVPKQLERICYFFQNPNSLFLKAQNQPDTKELLKKGKIEAFNKNLLNYYR